MQHGNVPNKHSCIRIDSFPGLHVPTCMHKYRYMYMYALERGCTMHAYKHLKELMSIIVCNKVLSLLRYYLEVDWLHNSAYMSR